MFLFVNACRRHYDTKEKEQEKSQERYDAALSKAGGVERLASGSDDFTLFMWEPTNDKKPTTRMTGHVGVVNHLAFSPDGKHLASASFDKKVKVWIPCLGQQCPDLLVFEKARRCRNKYLWK